jgi:hypothetical protein
VHPVICSHVLPRASAFGHQIRAVDRNRPRIIDALSLLFPTFDVF